ncbi:MAG: LPS assembly lipoprotein LptE [Pseudomonadota bacterium]|nr:LPS assembly lipoprotein LptE [Pseudomonadota bacterium]
MSWAKASLSTSVAQIKSLPRRASRGLALLSLAFLLLALPACGFHPVYGARSDDGTPVAEQLNQVAIDTIPERMGQMLRNELIDRMYRKGRPSQPSYHLTIHLRVTQEDLGIQADATSTRSLLNMFADYALLDMKDKEILHGTAHSISSYNTLNDQYGNLAAKNAAVQRTLNETGEQIVNRLSLYFSEKPSSSQTVPPSSSVSR